MHRKIRTDRVVLLGILVIVVLSTGIFAACGINKEKSGNISAEPSAEESSEIISTVSAISSDVSSDVSSADASSKEEGSATVSSATVSGGTSSKTVSQLSSEPSVQSSGSGATMPNMYAGIRWRSQTAQKYSLKYGRELLLINNDYELDETYEFRLIDYNSGKPITQYQLVHRDDNGFVYTVWVAEEAYRPMKQMMADAKAAGVPLYICSAYRSIKLQSSLFGDYVTKYGSAEKANTMRTYAGTSEHNTGLGFDLSEASNAGYLRQGFENTAQFKWLQEHAAEYGFVLRYTAEKQPITGIVYEPWHYRYVGVEHAKKMNELGMCLEEYIDYLGGL